MNKILLIITLMTTFQLFAASGVDCTTFDDSVVFMQIEVKKFPGETLNFAIQADQDCSLSSESKVSIFWKAKPGRAQDIGYACAHPAGLIKKVVSIDDKDKLSKTQIDLRMDVLETATSSTNKSMNEWINVELIKSKGTCKAKTVVDVDSKSHAINKIYLEKATVNFLLSPRITRAILYKTNGAQIEIKKD